VQSSQLTERENEFQKESTEESSSSEEIDDVLDSRISLVIGSFEFALWRMDGVWLV
jgi:hypothetical protein